MDVAHHVSVDLRRHQCGVAIGAGIWYILPDVPVVRRLSALLAVVAYVIATKFSKSVSRMPILVNGIQPSGALYPAVFLLMPMHCAYLKSVVGDGAGPLNPGVSTGVCMCGPDAGVDSDVDIVVIDSCAMDDVYIVCLPIGCRCPHADLPAVEVVSQLSARGPCFGGHTWPPPYVGGWAALPVLH